jgi:predicted esterase
VRSVVALNPWVYPADGDVNLSGRQVLIVHGTEDRIARPEASASAAVRLGRQADVSYVRVEGGKHAMLRRHRDFDRLASDFITATLLDGSRRSRVIDRVLASPGPLAI